jgi:hypothetical protein
LTPRAWRSRCGQLIGDIATARAGVPELLIQMARSENREDPDPQP